MAGKPLPGERLFRPERPDRGGPPARGLQSQAQQHKEGCPGRAALRVFPRRGLGNVCHGRLVRPCCLAEPDPLRTAGQAGRGTRLHRCLLSWRVAWSSPRLLRVDHATRPDSKHVPRRPWDTVPADSWPHAKHVLAWEAGAARGRAEGSGGACVRALAGGCGECNILQGKELALSARARKAWGRAAKMGWSFPSPRPIIGVPESENGVANSGKKVLTGPRSRAIVVDEVQASITPSRLP